MDEQNLYGRYWGCLQEFDQLHFELCYYLGIEYCIAHGLQHFDPGAQGEHKIQRGFEPINTWSLHHLRDPEFHRAVADFCLREAEQNNDYLEAAKALLPFKAS
jgi:predicted N-acyltransferase